MVEHSFGMYYQLFLRTGQVEIGTLKPLSLSVKVDVDVQGILKILQEGTKDDRSAGVTEACRRPM